MSRANLAAKVSIPIGVSLKSTALSMLETREWMYLDKGKMRKTEKWKRRKKKREIPMWFTTLDVGN